MLLPCCPVLIVVLDRSKIVRIFLAFIVLTIMLALLYMKNTHNLKYQQNVKIKEL